jgi:hypothetical protein
MSKYSQPEGLVKVIGEQLRRLTSFKPELEVIHAFLKIEECSSYLFCQLQYINNHTQPGKANLLVIRALYGLCSVHKNGFEIWPLREVLSNSHSVLFLKLRASNHFKPENEVFSF